MKFCLKALKNKASEGIAETFGIIQLAPLTPKFGAEREFGNKFSANSTQKVDSTIGDSITGVQDSHFKLGGRLYINKF